jgi:hypothetical protein
MLIHRTSSHSYRCCCNFPCTTNIDLLYARSRELEARSTARVLFVFAWPQLGLLGLAIASSTRGCVEEARYWLVAIAGWPRRASSFEKMLMLRQRHIIRHVTFVAPDNHRSIDAVVHGSAALRASRQQQLAHCAECMVYGAVCKCT